MGFRALGIRVQLGFEPVGLGLGFQDLGFEVSRFWGFGFGFRVWGLG